MRDGDSRGTWWPAAVGLVAVVALLVGLVAGVRWYRARPTAAERAAERAAEAPCPAFDGGPTIPDPPATPMARLATVVPGGVPFTVLAHHPSAPEFLADRTGRVWAYPDGVDQPPVLDLRDRVSTERDQGFLGLAVDPAGHHLYAYFTDERGDSTLASWPLIDRRPQLDGERLILLVDQQGRPPNHKGGGLLFGPDGTLYLSLGDGGRTGDHEDDAQRLDSLLGKVLRIQPTPDDPERPYRIPSDNPFVGRAGAREEIVASGLRNPFRISLDATGALWIGDVGLNCVEEVSVVPADSSDRNLGWNRMEGVRPFLGSAPADHVAPVVTYAHSDEWCAVIGGTVYRGADLPELAGWYVFGDLCAGRLLALAPDRSELRDLGVVARQLVAIVERPDLELEVLSLTGGVSALLPLDAPDPRVLAAPVDEPPTGGDAIDGATLFATHCAVCHGSDGSGGVGPALGDGRAVRRFPDPGDQRRVVTDGRGAMPGFGDRLDDAEIEAVVTYVRRTL